MTCPLYLIDAFTSEPFAGNPAGVCLLTKPQPDSWMQAVAREMNQAETAFLLRQEGGFGLRWFTPTLEVDLCGHATLASAHFLWEESHLEAGAAARFHSKSGLLTAAQRDGWIILDFPSTPVTPVEPPAELFPALGVSKAPVFQSRFDYLVALERAEQVRAVRPDLTRLGGIKTRGVIVTAPADQPGTDFISRFFAPAAGVPEDPVTGSAHCALAPYWTERLGRKSLVGYQASPRGGVVRVEQAGDRVLLGGKATTVLKGTLSAG